MKIRWLSLALADLDEVGKYIAEDNPRQAVAVVLRIIDAVELLVDHPEIGRPGRVGGTRELVVADLPYIIPYRKKGEWLEILRVFHQKRKWPPSF